MKKLTVLLVGVILLALPFETEAHHNEINLTKFFALLDELFETGTINISYPELNAAKDIFRSNYGHGYSEDDVDIEVEHPTTVADDTYFSYQISINELPPNSLIALHLECHGHAGGLSDLQLYGDRVDTSLINNNPNGCGDAFIFYDENYENLEVHAKAHYHEDYNGSLSEVNLRLRIESEGEILSTKLYPITVTQ